MTATHLIGLALPLLGGVPLDATTPCPSNPAQGILNPGQAVACSVGDILSAITNFVLGRLIDLLNWLQQPNGAFTKIMTTAVNGDISGLCRVANQNAADDCGGSTYATTLALYAEVLGLCCWGYSVLRALNDPSQADLPELLYHVRRGLLMMAGIWLCYPAARFLWELCRVASNAMVFDINGGAAIQPPHVNTGGQYPQAEIDGFGMVAILETLFLSIWMVASTVGVLVGAIFGSFAVAVSPAGGIQGKFGRYLEVMSGFYLLRLFLPPASAVMIGLMNHFVSNNNGALPGGDVAAVIGMGNLVIAFALLWASGKVVQFLSSGIAAGAGTIGGMLDVGAKYRGAASNLAFSGPAAAARATDRMAMAKSARYSGMRRRVQTTVGSVVRSLGAP